MPILHGVEDGKELLTNVIFSLPKRTSAFMDGCPSNFEGYVVLRENLINHLIPSLLETIQSQVKLEFLHRAVHLIVPWLILSSRVIHCVTHKFWWMLQQLRPFSWHKLDGNYTETNLRDT